MIRDACNGSYDFVDAAWKYSRPYYQTRGVLEAALADAQEAARALPWRGGYYTDDCCAIRAAIAKRDRRWR
jgi:hypothetical protein